MENQPYRVCVRACEGAGRQFMYSVVSRVESFTTVDLPEEGKPSSIPAGKTVLTAEPVRAAKVVKQLTMLKALAPRAMFAETELCLDGTSLTAPALLFGVATLGFEAQSVNVENRSAVLRQS
ncbi:hypothetical protein ACXR0O_02940 [Verrucomicrobiota bacterium sgz303538]